MSDDAPSPLAALAEEGLEVEIRPDGIVRIHAQCRPGQDPAECEARVRDLIDALGIPADGVETVVAGSGTAPREGAPPSQD